MFVGRRFSEQKLIKFAYAFEQATMVYKKNKLIIEPTSDIIDIGGPISHV
jgi:amidase